MKYLDRIAHAQNRRDEVPNQELARELAAAKNKAGIREIAEGLRNDDPAIQADCLKVMYEIGYLEPDLVSDYFEDFVKLLRSKNNRLVWGAMIALATIADRRPAEILKHVEEIKECMAKGSVITVDNGVAVLAKLSSKSSGKELFAFLLAHLRTCRPKEVPQHAEKILVAVNSKNKAAFLAALEQRAGVLTSSQAARLKRVVKEAEKR